MKKNLIYFVIILIIISLDPKMAYWSSQGNFSNAILKLLVFQPMNKCISSFHLHILMSTISSNSKERTLDLEDDMIKNPFWLLQKTYMSTIVPHFTSLSWEGNLSFTASQDMKDLLGKSALDHTTFHHSVVSILFLISLQVEIHVTFPYLDEVRYIKLS